MQDAGRILKGETRLPRLLNGLACRDWHPGIPGERRTEGVRGELSWHVTPCRLCVHKILKARIPATSRSNRPRNSS